MRISIALGPFHEPPPRGFGAVEKVWWSLAEALARAGHRVHVNAKGSPGTVPAQRSHTTRFLRGFQATGWLPLDLVKDFVFALQTLLALPRADVLVTNSFWLPVLAAPFKRWKGRVVVHVARFPKGQMFLYRGADLLHTVSSPIAQAIEAQCPPLRERIAVIGYPIELQAFRVPAPRTSAPIILYAGRIHPEKGVHMLAAAFRRVHEQFPTARLRIVGPWREASGGGGEAYLDRIRRRLEGMPAEIVPPIADEAELAGQYRQAEVFCYPSLAARGETFGRAVLEAMASGVPCVVSSLPCFADFLEPGRHGLVFDHETRDAEGALAEAICSLLSDPVRADRMGRDARARAGRYAMESLASEYAGMLDRVVRA